MSLHEKWMEDPEYARAYAEESLIQDAEEMLLQAMSKAGVTRAEIARRLGVDRAAVTRYFQSNLTLRKIAAICFVLGVVPRLTFGRGNPPKPRAAASGANGTPG